MSVSFVLILSILSISFVQSNPPFSIPAVICQYRGKNLSGPPFQIKDVPERCNVIIFDIGYFNDPPKPEDIDAIKALKAAGKTVYMFYTYGFELEEMSLSIIALNMDKLDERMKPMIAFLKDNQICTVIIGYVTVPADSTVNDYAGLVDSLVCKIKKAIPTIKVGLCVSGLDGPNYSNERLFNFTVTNTDVDMYVIDTSQATLVCFENTTCAGGRMPVISPYRDTVPLKALCDFVSGSHMDMAKVVIGFFIYASKVDASGSESFQSYSKFCQRPPKELWCGDSMQIFHDQVSFVKKTFKGMMLSFLDLDDMDNSCKCEKFPVTNAYIDAWEGKAVKKCDLIS